MSEIQEIKHPGVIFSEWMSAKNAEWDQKEDKNFQKKSYKKFFEGKTKIHYEQVTYLSKEYKKDLSFDDELWRTYDSMLRSWNYGIPVYPVQPKEKITQQKEIFTLSDCTMSLQEILDKVGKNADLNKVFINIDTVSYDDYDSNYTTTVKIYSDVEIDNPNYKKELKQYEKDLKILNILTPISQTLQKNKIEAEKKNQENEEKKLYEKLKKKFEK